MSFEWPSAAAVSRSFHASGAAAPNTPSLPQSAPAARTWLIRASRLVRKSGRLHVDGTVAVVPPVAVPPAGVLAAGAAAGPGADEDPSPPPPPHAATAAASAA